MAMVWLVIQILFLFLFFSLPALTELPVEPDETTPLHTEHPVINRTVASQSPSRLSWTVRVWCLIREETIVVLAVLFVVMFQQTALEVIIAFCCVTWWKFCPF